MSQTIEQKRALYAYTKVNEWIDDNSLDKVKLKTILLKMPIMVLQNGLGQMLSFVLAGKNTQVSQELNNLLQEWLCGDNDEDHPCKVYQSGKLIEKLINGSRDEYMRAQQETLELFNWVIKFSKAKLEVNE